MRPQWYEHEANIPAIVRLLEVYYSSSSPAGAQQLEPYLTRTLGVIQKLLTTRKVENEGFRLLRAVFLFMRPVVVAPYEAAVLQVILARMQMNKTPKFCLCFVQFLALLIHKRGILAVQTLIENIQPGLFLMLWEKIVLEHAERASSAQRKLLVVAMADFLGNQTIFNALIQPDRRSLWAATLRCVLNLVTDANTGSLLPNSAFSATAGNGGSSDAARQQDLLFWEIREDTGDARNLTVQDVNVQIFNQLVHAQCPMRDDAADVGVDTIPRYIMQQIRNLSTALGNNVVPHLCSTLDKTSQERLNVVTQSA